MSHYELADILGSYIAYAMAGMSLYLTVVSGYILVAYLAGASLSKSQSFIVNSIFIPFSLFTVAIKQTVSY